MNDSFTLCVSISLYSRSFRQVERPDITKKETSQFRMLTVAKRSTHNNQEVPMYYSGIDLHKDG